MRKIFKGSKIRHKKSSENYLQGSCKKKLEAFHHILVFQILAFNEIHISFIYLEFSPRSANTRISSVIVGRGRYWFVFFSFFLFWFRVFLEIRLFLNWRSRTNKMGLWEEVEQSYNMSTDLPEIDSCFSHRILEEPDSQEHGISFMNVLQKEFWQLTAEFRLFLSRFDGKGSEDTNLTILSSLLSYWELAFIFVIKKF